jgi:hypothetical protein
MASGWVLGKIKDEKQKTPDSFVGIGRWRKNK